MNSPVRSPITLPDTHQLDVTQEPYGADPTGQTDSTAAIVTALETVLLETVRGISSTLAKIDALGVENGRLGASCENRRQNGRSICIFPEIRPYAPTLYFPAGTYLVSDSIRHRLSDLKNSGGLEMCWQIRFRGEGPEKSILRLQDGAAGFDGPTPKPVVGFMVGNGSNVAMSNYFEDIGIHTGRGNPSAIGLDFYTNNAGAVRNVIIQSGDGAGHAGMFLGHGNYSGVLLKNIRTDGFDYGCHFDSHCQTMFFAAEHVKVRNARIAGIFVGGISASLRGIDYSGDRPGLICDHASGHVNLVDSQLEGNGPCAIEHRSGVLYADNVRVSGFGTPLHSALPTSDDETIPERSDLTINDLVLPRRCDSHDISPVPRLAVEETPVFNPSTGAKTVGVKEFGALGDGTTNDSDAIQKAFNSGANEIVFEPGRYCIGHPVRVPAGVERIGFNFCDLVSASPLRESAGVGAFQVVGDSSRPLFIEDLFAWEEWCGSHVMIDHASTRTLVLSDLHTQTLCLYRNSVRGGRVFMENVATTAGVVPGNRGHGRKCIHFQGQQVWARQVNPERGEPMVMNDGGQLWVLGFKSEDAGVAFHTINGGRTEVLGGVLNGGAADAVAFVSEDSAIRVSAVSNGWEAKSHFGTSVLETRDGSSTTIPNAACVSRQFPEKRGPQISISLYSSPALPSPPRASD